MARTAPLYERVRSVIPSIEWPDFASDIDAILALKKERDAVILARQKELDLVEIAPTAQPPVCRIMNLGKYMYQQSKKAQAARKKQKTVLVKEVKFRPKTDEHDYLFKRKHIERFIGDGHKVKATIMFRGREMAHPEIGRRILERLMEELREMIEIERPPRQEGNNMIAIFAAKK